MRKYIISLVISSVAPLFFVSAQTQSLFDLENLGNQNLADITAYKKIKIIDAWNFLEKKLIQLGPVSIGIFDTGVDTTHPEFQGVSTTNKTAKDFYEARGGHGTQITGIIGANNVSSLGTYIPPQMNGVVSGIRNLNYNLKIELASMLTGFILEDSFRHFLVLDELAQSPDGINIINYSFGAPLCSSLSTPRRLERFLRGLKCHGLKDFNTNGDIFSDLVGQYPDILFVLAGGNDGIDDRFNMPGGSVNAFNTVAVGGTNIIDGRVEFSGTLEASNFGATVNISAPGEKIYAPKPGGGYDANFSGTSASAPLVTGVAAILKALEPEYKKYHPGLIMTPEKIKEVLMKSADPIKVDKPLGSGCFDPNNNPQGYNGCRLNAHRAVAWLLPPTPVILNTPIVVPVP